MKLVISAEDEDILMHYGILRKSGRYPWGSGETQSERNQTFLGMVTDLRKQGLSEPDIARGLGIVDKNGNPSTTQLRALKTIALNQQKQDNIATAEKLRAKGMSNVAIGKQMGINESSVRNLLAPGVAERADILQATSSMLRRQVDEKDFIDIGAGVENHLGISDQKLKVAVAMLQEEGYQKHYIKIRQVGTGHETTYKVLTKPGIPWKEVNAAVQAGQLRQIQEHSDDGGRSFLGILPPLSISSSRVGVRYKEEGGAEADGVIYVRPGKEDISLGHSRYAQVRIAVDGSHYLKGMAVYKDDLPDGVDLLFNTNKSSTGNKLDAMKELKKDKDGNIDQDNPFGASISRQIPKYDIHGRPVKNSVSSVMNIVNEEGKWDEWSRTLSTQFLSKQSPTLAREQLDMTYERKRNELNEILSLTNPAVKKRLLESFSDDMDSSAIHMKAQALPRQRTQVILPISSLKANEIYAPNFKPGERVVLVRHPHGGTFEIPELVVTDKNPEARKILGHGDKASKDAIGINHEVAAHLSGADFDGDTVLVIPNNAGRVKVDRALEGLKGFDPQSEYKPYHGMRTIDGGTYNAETKKVEFAPGKSSNGQAKQTQMGLISNLITDMTIQKASHGELARAVRHSMVVIDAEKHHLDYRASSQKNGIPALMKKYQGGRSTGGASTLISRAKSEIDVPQQKLRRAKEGGPIDPATGKLVYVPTGEHYVSKRTGEVVYPTQKVSKLLSLGSAHDLVSTGGTLIEKIYADHSDRVRSLGNEARKHLLDVQPIPMSPSAKAAYAPHVETLKAKLNEALKNAPRERQAQVLANATISQKKAAYPDMDRAEEKKIRSQALVEMRARTGAGKARIKITDEEWAAIQAGAISNNMLKKILDNSDLDVVKQLATPHAEKAVSSAYMARAKSMLNSGYSPADVAAQLGVPLSTLSSALKKEGISNE